MSVIKNIAVIWLIVGIAIGLMIWGFVRSTRRARKLIETGTPLEATIVKVLNSGTVVSGSSGVTFLVLLEIALPGESPFQIEKSVYMSLADAGKVRPGSKVKVVVDPKTKRVAIPGSDDQL